MTTTLNLANEAFERFPFGVIFSKTAPTNLSINDENTYVPDYETDFCYYYFSPGLEERSSLKRISMLTGNINAKRDFPTDYEQYFRDDFEVMSSYANGEVKAFSEPWNPPGVIGSVHFLYTRKTAFVSRGSQYMLGTFELINDTVVGTNDGQPFAVPFCAKSALPVCSAYDIPAQWFTDAFRALPIGLAIATLQGVILTTNHCWDQLAPSEDEFAVLQQLSSTTTTPLSCAYWMQQGPEDSGRGVYHIVHPITTQVFAVYVLRPSMHKQANPYYLDGALVSR